VKVYRHGQRDRRITGTFGAETLSVLPARASRTRTARCANGARRRCRVSSA
jgi:hypothetical protein